MKALLRDAKFYADPATDSGRLELADAAHAARIQGMTREMTSAIGRHERSVQPLRGAHEAGPSVSVARA